MTVKRAGGAVAASVEDLDMTAWVPDDPIYTMNETAYRELPVPGGGATFRYKLWNSGDRKRLSEITAAFTADTVYPTPPDNTPPSAPVTLIATLTANYLGVDTLTGDGLGWSIDVDVPATDPVCTAVVWVNGSNTDPIVSGGSALGAFQVAGTPITCRLIDVGSGLEDDEQFELADGVDNGPFTLTVNVP